MSMIKLETNSGNQRAVINAGYNNTKENKMNEKSFVIQKIAWLFWAVGAAAAVGFGLLALQGSSFEFCLGFGIGILALSFLIGRNMTQQIQQEMNRLECLSAQQTMSEDRNKAESLRVSLQAVGDRAVAVWIKQIEQARTQIDRKSVV